MDDLQRPCGRRAGIVAQRDALADQHRIDLVQAAGYRKVRSFMTRRLVSNRDWSSRSKLASVAQVDRIAPVARRIRGTPAHPPCRHRTVALRLIMSYKVSLQTSPTTPNAPIFVHPTSFFRTATDRLPAFDVSPSPRFAQGRRRSSRCASLRSARSTWRASSAPSRWMTRTPSSLSGRSRPSRSRTSRAVASGPLPRNRRAGISPHPTVEFPPTRTRALTPSSSGSSKAVATSTNHHPRRPNPYSWPGGLPPPWLSLLHPAPSDTHPPLARPYHLWSTGGAHDESSAIHL